MAAFTSASLFLATILLSSAYGVSSCGSCQSPPRPPSSPCPPDQPGSSGGGRCPRDVIKLGACVDLLGIINLNIGTPPRVPCCSLLEGLADLEAALCLCTTLNANVLGIQLSIPISLTLLLNYCGRTLPTGFLCP